MRYIYYIKNKKNNKYYIGLTNNYKRRKKRHFSDLRNNRHDNCHLQSAFNKYGENNFEFKVIYEENCTIEHISEMEKMFIAKYNSFKDGYNMNKGGFDNNGFVSKFSKEDVFNILAVLQNINLAGEVLAEIYNTTGTTISRINKGETCGEYKKEFDSLSEDIRSEIYATFDTRFNISDSIQRRQAKGNRKFSEKTYFYMLAYNEKHKRKSPMMANILGCCPSTIRLFIKGSINLDIYNKYKSLDDHSKKLIYIEAKNLFENNASLCGNT